MPMFFKIAICNNKFRSPSYLASFITSGAALDFDIIFGIIFTYIKKFKLHHFH